MSVTDDPHSDCLHETDLISGLQKCYLILPDGKRKDLVRPLRRTYIHLTCGTTTTMGKAIAETYAAQPNFYGATMCIYCRDHFPVGKDGEFVWDVAGYPKVGT